MCGIAGSIGTIDTAFARAMTIALRHRGPDSSSTWTNGRASWAHTRLAIVGLGPDGDQPFVSSDGQITVIYNGEIYNHEELRRRFAIQAGPTDGAVLPDLWAQLGPQCLAELRGMFSIAVWDDRSSRCWLAVDPMGMKPLYVATRPDGAYFASEITPLAQFLELPVDDVTATVEFRDWGCLSSGSAGVKGARRLSPGTVVEFDASGQVLGTSVIGIGPWRRAGETWDDAIDKFRSSVAMHLQADVPTALLLSSGVDSASIAWAAAEAGQRLHCITLDFAGGGREADLASAIARRFGHDHTVIDSAAAVDQFLAGFLAAVDRPSVDGFNTYIACRVLRERGFKVALSGAGGDELLLGYAHHHRRGLGTTAERWARILASRVVERAGPDRQVPKRLDAATRLTQAVARGSLSRQPHQRVRAARSHRPLAHSHDLGPREPLSQLLPEEWSVAGAFALADWMDYLVPMLLADSDVYSMAAGVEMRLPFVDLGVWASVLGIPQRRMGKGDFVRATGDSLLKEVYARPKTGFDVPFWRSLPRSSAPAEAAPGYWIDEHHARLNAWRTVMWEAWTARLQRNHTSVPASRPSDLRPDGGNPPAAIRGQVPPLRIALVTQAGKDNGGVGSIVAWLDEGLRARGHSVDIHELARSSVDPRSTRFLRPASWWRSPKSEVAPTGVTLWGAQFVELETNRYRPRSELTQVLNGYDIVQVVSGTPALGNVVADVESTTLLQVATTLAMERPARLGISPAKRALSRALLPMLNRSDISGVQSVDHVLVENTYMHRWCIEHGQTNVLLIPPGIDRTTFKPLGEWDPAGPIVALGRLGEQRKDWPTVVAAYEQLVLRYPKAGPLLIAGRGPVDDSLTTRIRNSPNADCIAMRVDVPPADLPTVLQAGSIFVQASLEEGLGLAGLEAMACGLPVVSTATVGSSQYVRDGHNGYLVPLGRRTAAGLADKMHALLSEPSLGLQLRRNAIETVRRDYDSERALDQIAQHYESISRRR